MSIYVSSMWSSYRQRPKIYERTAIESRFKQFYKNLVIVRGPSQINFEAAKEKEVLVGDLDQAQHDLLAEYHPAKIWSI